jgi:hypothetical protein
MRIVHELDGIVSERFIRQCLPEKYKQKHRVKNAKKQKKKKAIKGEEKLAAIPQLNQEEIEEQEAQEEKNKKIVLVAANDGSSISIEDNADKPSTLSNPNTDIDITSNSEASQCQQQEKQSIRKLTKV